METSVGVKTRRESAELQRFGGKPYPSGLGAQVDDCSEARQKYCRPKPARSNADGHSRSPDLVNIAQQLQMVAGTVRPASSLPRTLKVARLRSALASVQSGILEISGGRIRANSRGVAFHP